MGKCNLSRAVRSGNDIELHGNVYPTEFPLGSNCLSRLARLSLESKLHHQYSSGKSNVVTERSASVMTQSFSVSVIG